MTDRDGAPAPGGAAGTFAIVGAQDEAVWSDVLARTHQHDFHHLAGYHRLAERRGEGVPLLFTYRADDYLIALPLLLRAVDADDPEGLQDATSVYGYAGPIASHERIPHHHIQAFQAALRQELIGRQVVSVFSRLHPLIAQDELLTGLGEIRTVGFTISVDLTIPPEEQWAGYSKKTRRIIRRAQEAGTICIDDREGVYQRAWVDLYQATMRRVGAAPAYLFDAEYFEVLAAELGSALHLFVALLDGKVAAAGLFTICDGIVQAHLGALNQDYAKLSPTRFLDDTARRWAAEAGARVFHLGGGVGGQEDSLYHYKAGFSDRRHEFATWRWIVDEAAYRELCERHRHRGAPGDSAANADYFPEYRRQIERP